MASAAGSSRRCQTARRGCDDKPRKRLWVELDQTGEFLRRVPFPILQSVHHAELFPHTVPWFFKNVARLKVSDLFIRLRGLTDPAEQGRFRNHAMSVRLDDPKLDAHQALKAEVERAIDSIRGKVELILKYRDKAVAHSGYDVTLRLEGANLPKLPQALIEECVTETGNVYNLVNERLHGAHAHFELKALGDTELLVVALGNSSKWNAAELRRMRYEHGLPPEAQ